MDTATTFVGDKIKELVKSSQNFIDGVVHRRNNSSRRNPIEVLKRLQREVFSDVMKLRDRQDKVERILSLYNTSKDGPFHEPGTRVRGEVDAVGAVLMMGGVDQDHYDALARAGMRTGTDSRFVFQTTVREKDALVAEFVASRKCLGYGGDLSGDPLSLAKVLYLANICDWFSAIAVPVGAQFRDFGVSVNSGNQRMGFTDMSSLVPPHLNQRNGIAFGLRVKKSNVIASMARSISGLEMHPLSGAVGHCLSTFGQVVCELPKGVKLSLSGLLQVPKSSTHHVNVGALAIPMGPWEHNEAPETPETTALRTVASQSISLKLETELDENVKIGGWIEMNNSNPKHLHWAVGASDESEEELGWGLNVSGTLESSRRCNRIQTESYLKLNLGKKFSLKPGIVYVMDGNTRIFGVMLRSDWSF